MNTCPENEHSASCGELGWYHGYFRIFNPSLNWDGPFVFRESCDLSQNEARTKEETTTQVELYDTTLRDGAQYDGISLSVEDKLTITDRLDQLGVHYIEGGWSGSNPKDAEFFEEISGPLPFIAGNYC